MKSVTYLHKNTSAKNQIPNAMRVGDIDTNKLLRALGAILSNLIRDFGKPVDSNLIDHLRYRLFEEIYGKRKNMLWGEFCYVVEMGVRGHWGLTTAVTVKNIIVWLEGYRREKHAKSQAVNIVSHQKSKKNTSGFNPNGQYFARAIIYRRENSELMEMTLGQVAEGVKKGKSPKQIYDDFKSTKN